MDPPDESLLGQFLAGDAGAFELLMRRYERAVLAVAFRMLGDADAAADVFQETFVNVYRYAPRFDPSRRLSTWIFQIAINQARKELRRLARKAAEVDPELVIREALSDEPSPEQLAEASELRACVAEALARLPVEQREVVVLRHWGGLTCAEIAEALDCPQGTVKSRMHKAFQRLGEFLVQRRVARPKEASRGIFS